MTIWAALKTALSGAYLVRAIVVMLLVGSILNLVNQGDALLRGAAIDWVKVSLTYPMPFCVATYGAASALAASR